MPTYRYIWVPWESGYKEHLDRLDISHDHISAIREQTAQFKDGLLNQTLQISDQTKQQVASGEQIISAVDRGFDRLSQINERGFDQVTSSIESLHSSMCFLVGTVIQRLDYQNSILEGILSTLKTPRETQIKEYFVQGMEFKKQGKLALAEDCFKKSIALEMGEYFFPSHYQLGLIYLQGKTEKTSLVDPKKAMDYLLKAYELGDGKEKIDKWFAPLLADCKLYLSQSYYFQVTGAPNELELELISSAIRYAKESVQLNSNLSWGFYQLAKYSSYAMHAFEMNTEDRVNHSKSLTTNFKAAATIDRNYLLQVRIDPVLEPNMKLISESIAELTEKRGREAKNKLAEAKTRIARFKARNISKYTELGVEFDEVLWQVQLAEKDFYTNTYFGFDDCVLGLDK